MKQHPAVESGFRAPPDRRDSLLGRDGFYPGHFTARVTDHRSPIALFLLIGFCAIGPAIAQQATPPNAEDVSKGVGIIEAYQDLLKDNLAQRKELDTCRTEMAELKKQNSELAGRAIAREKELADLAGVAAKLQQDNSTAPLDKRIAELESGRAELTRERDALSAKVVSLEKKIDALSLVGTAPEARGPVIAPGTDLFRQLEQENAVLKARIAEIQAQRRSAEDKLGQQGEMEDELASARVYGEEHRKNLLQIVRHTKRLKGDVALLESKLAEKESALRQAEQQASVTGKQLDVREQQLAKIIRAKALMDRIEEQQRVVRMSDGERSEVYRRKGEKHVLKGRLDEAVREFRRALELTPSDPDLHYNLGIIYDDELGDDTKAIAHYNAYIELNPTAPDLDLVRMWAHQAEVDMQQVREAEFARDERVKFLLQQADRDALSPSMATQRDRHCNMAEVHARQGDFGKAVYEYTQALLLDPSAANVHYNLAIIYDDELEDKPSAAKHYRAYVELRPNAPDVDSVRSWMMDAELDL